MEAVFRWASARVKTCHFQLPDIITRRYGHNGSFRTGPGAAPPTPAELAGSKERAPTSDLPDPEDVAPPAAPHVPTLVAPTNAHVEEMIDISDGEDGTEDV